MLSNEMTFNIPDIMRLGLKWRHVVWAHTALNIKPNIMLVGLRNDKNDIDMWALIVNRILAYRKQFLEPHRYFMPTPWCVVLSTRSVGGCWGNVKYYTRDATG